MITSSDLPPIWVVYDHPKDYPKHYVARYWNGWEKTDEIMLSFKLELLQLDLSSMGLVQLSRSDKDDPCIVEVWL